ncbi:hypothetical protein C8F04DRAFT_1351586 [Mycena alexandri]|uniref:Uncharacterized protein n=1 Tax=Mycena alexandri TaxID=1745969 RepID=A0AAD6XCH7_9AGAR|nr:hypothetical protein C8F04DRAFT_1351586 [Mycena alexandri]
MQNSQYGEIIADPSETHSDRPIPSRELTGPDRFGPRIDQNQVSKSACLQNPSLTSRNASKLTYFLRQIFAMCNRGNPEGWFDACEESSEPFSADCAKFKFVSSFPVTYMLVSIAVEHERNCGSSASCKAPPLVATHIQKSLQASSSLYYPSACSGSYYREGDPSTRVCDYVRAISPFLFPSAAAWEEFAMDVEDSTCAELIVQALRGVVGSSPHSLALCLPAPLEGFYPDDPSHSTSSPSIPALPFGIFLVPGCRWPGWLLAVMPFSCLLFRESNSK